MSWSVMLPPHVCLLLLLLLLLLTDLQKNQVLLYHSNKINETGFCIYILSCLNVCCVLNEERGVLVKLRGRGGSLDR